MALHATDLKAILRDEGQVQSGELFVVYQCSGYTVFKSHAASIRPFLVHVLFA